MTLPPSPGLITVRLFANLREQAGWGERQLTLETGGMPLTAIALWHQLGLKGSPTVRIAVNQAFAAPDQVLEAGDEVAFLPPISGG